MSLAILFLSFLLESNKVDRVCSCAPSAVPASYDQHLGNIVSSSATRSRMGPTPARDYIRTAATFVHNQMDEARERVHDQVANATQQVQQVAGAVQNAGREAANVGHEIQYDVSKDIKKKM